MASEWLDLYKEELLEDWGLVENRADFAPEFLYRIDQEGVH